MWPDHTCARVFVSLKSYVYHQSNWNNRWSQCDFDTVSPTLTINIKLNYTHIHTHIICQEEESLLLKWYDNRYAINLPRCHVNRRSRPAINLWCTVFFFEQQGQMWPFSYTHINVHTIFRSTFTVFHSAHPPTLLSATEQTIERERKRERKQDLHPLHSLPFSLSLSFPFVVTSATRTLEFTYKFDFRAVFLSQC